MLEGARNSRPWSANVYSANAAPPEPMILSPTLTPLASGPSSATSPAHSMPSTVPAPPAAPWAWPLVMPRSARLRPQALTLTSTCVPFGEGFATSVMAGPLAGEGGVGVLPQATPFVWREPPPGSHLRCDPTSPASGRGEASADLTLP